MRKGAVRRGLAVILVALMAAAGADEPAQGDAAIIRVPLPGGSTFPISSAVRTSAETSLVYFSGIVPTPKDADAPFRSRAYWGDTREQTMNVLQRLTAMLASMDLSFGNAVKMTAYLVGDPSKGGAMDFDGFMEAYRQFFGSAAQPELPARSAVQVEGLANEGMLVEIELVLARAPAVDARLAPAADAAQTGAAALESCLLCHGTAAHGNAVVGAPNLSILEPWYLEAQLRAYRDGVRGADPEDAFGAEMQPVAARLSDADLLAAVEHVTRSPRAAGSITVEGDVGRGEQLYQSCAGCHGLDAMGVEGVGGPRLAGQNDWYLARQLEAYRQGLRPSGGSAASMQMAAAARTLAAPNAVLDVVAYLNTLSGAATMSMQTDGE